jgi:hypothetical protein
VGVSHYGLAILHFKVCILRRQKEELWRETQIYFTMQKLYLIFKNKKKTKKSSKRNQNPPRYYNSIITNLKFQHKPKYYYLSKILI